MTVPILWPQFALPVQNYRVDPAFRNTRGPASLDGLTQYASSDAGLWMATFDTIAVRQRNGRRDIELWHALAGLLEGRLTPIVLPVPVSGRRPLPAGVSDRDIDTCKDAVPFGDDSLLDDGSGFETGWIDVALAANAARRATTLLLTKTFCGEIRPGMRFSMDVGLLGAKPIRAYQVKRVVSQTEEAATVAVWPPLREALSSGERIEFAKPHVQMRLMSDGGMDLIVMRRGDFQFQTVDFVEDL